MHDNVLQAFNGCLRRPDGDKRYLIWNGAHNHPEIGSAFVGYLHAFIEALVETFQEQQSRSDRDHLCLGVARKVIVTEEGLPLHLHTGDIIDVFNTGITADLSRCGG